MSYLYYILTFLILLASVQPPGPAGAAMRAVSGFEPAFSVSPVEGGVYEKISGISWKPGCPVPIEDLRLVNVVYADFDRRVKTGELICHYLVADELCEIFSEIYEAGFPIARVSLIDEYGGDDLLSMEDNNTSAFNYRTVSGSASLSRHAYGLAIDINPVQNPYVEEQIGYVSPEAGRGYLDRNDIRPGMITRGDKIYTAFVSRGWTWGGDWRYQIDYQHFQKSVELR